jgi:SRSO17 transposase
LRSRFCALRVRAAHDLRAREQQWLLIEWPKSEPKPVHYWLCNLPAATRMKSLVATVMGRWRIERDYQELKSERGLHHYEGRNWRGLHHHGSLCIAASGLSHARAIAQQKKLRSTQNTCPTHRLPPARVWLRCSDTSPTRSRPWPSASAV